MNNRCNIIHKQPPKKCLNSKQSSSSSYFFFIVVVFYTCEFLNNRNCLYFCRQKGRNFLFRAKFFVPFCCIFYDYISLALQFLVVFPFFCTWRKYIKIYTRKKIKIVRAFQTINYNNWKMLKHKMLYYSQQKNCFWIGFRFFLECFKKNLFHYPQDSLSPFFLVFKTSYYE